MDYGAVLGKERLTGDDRRLLLRAKDPGAVEDIRRFAQDLRLRQCGPYVYLRGLVEFSNICSNDCLYCGIRRSNKNVKRYELNVDRIVECSQWCASMGYGSVVLQSGERRDERFVDLVADAVGAIKQRTRSAALPGGLGITLCVGEQTPETYRRFFEAGAHRYLLRIETSNPVLFGKIHPPDQTLSSRIECLKVLREVGFQVGTGVMIGIPGQTTDDLADDIEFFVRHDIDMIGMGPFIPHDQTPLWSSACPDEAERLRTSLLMIAVTRCSLPDINIAATTALQTLDEVGREKGLLFGANVIMPLLTPVDVRSDYLLYPGKPFFDETASQCMQRLESRITGAGLKIGYDQWGDSIHARKRQGTL